MAFEIKILPNNTLFIQYKGTVTKEEVYAARINAQTMIHSNNLDKMLVDLSKASPKMSSVDIFNIAASNKKAYSEINENDVKQGMES